MSTSQERSAAASFVERHGLWSEEQFEAAKKAEKLIEELEVVRWRLDEIASRLGEIEDAKTLAGLLLYLSTR